MARVSALLYEHGANILHADQHQDHDLGLFFMRVEWALAMLLLASLARIRSPRPVPQPVTSIWTPSRQPSRRWPPSWACAGS